MRCGFFFRLDLCLFLQSRDRELGLLGIGRVVLLAKSARIPACLHLCTRIISFSLVSADTLVDSIHCILFFLLAPPAALFGWYCYRAAVVCISALKAGNIHIHFLLVVIFFAFSYFLEAPVAAMEVNSLGILSPSY